MSQPAQVPKTDPAPNFFVTNTVTVDIPWQKAYRIFGTTEGHESVCRLSKLCTKTELYHTDTIHLPLPEYPGATNLEDVALRTLVAHDTAAETSSASSAATVIKRQHFLMEETVPLLFGMIQKRVVLKGTLSWNDALLHDEDASLSPPTIPIQSLYETRSQDGIQVWKLRTFEPLPDNKTKITERIEGCASAWLRAIVESEASKGHRAHLDLYSKLC